VVLGCHDSRIAPNELWNDSNRITTSVTRPDHRRRVRKPSSSPTSKQASGQSGLATPDGDTTCARAPLPLELEPRRLRELLKLSGCICAKTARTTESCGCFWLWDARAVLVPGRSMDHAVGGQLLVATGFRRLPRGDAGLREVDLQEVVCRHVKLTFRSSRRRLGSSSSGSGALAHVVSPACVASPD